MRSGYFKMNPKFRAARIIYSNGNESQTLVTKRQALEIGESMIGICVTYNEWLAIREQIHASNLPDKDSILEHMCNEMQGDLDELKHQIERSIRFEKRNDNDGDEWKDL